MSYTREQAMARLADMEMQGWSALVNEAFDILGDDYTVTSIHQKYAELQIAFQPFDKTIGARLADIEARSIWHCEVCGAPADWVEINEWEYTRCPIHSPDADKREAHLPGIAEDLADIDEKILFYLNRRQELRQQQRYGHQVFGINDGEQQATQEKLQRTYSEDLDMDSELWRKFRSIID